MISQQAHMAKENVRQCWNTILHHTVHCTSRRYASTV